MKERRNAFTLAEIMVALAVITILLTVTLSVSKSKLENAIRYSYYAAYTVLQQAVKEIVYENANAATPISGLDTSGANVCTKMRDFLNLNSATPCAGTPNLTDTSNFAADSTKPDLVLRNGIKLYNIQTYKTGLTGLDGTDDEKNGYVVYADVNGTQGKSQLYKDVFPFYITISGKVAPAWKSGTTAGGNYNRHLEVSVKYFQVDGSGKRTVMWLDKSVSFREAACHSGYITGTYCTAAPAVSKSAVCTNTADYTADCRIVPIKPGII
ncbi:MAG: type II secretion system GspH family protein [Heliobacteriaceae bacterium]|jgi:prepilin-type N-terminal cleavage/methylation domain-containing protein|nr:type II secretion system GspH family protein [Heliobacteriaceae bacterium]